MPRTSESLPTTPEIVSSLSHDQSRYRFDPSPQLRYKTAIGLVGPAGIGKTTLSNEVARIDPDIDTIHTKTTRRRRADDPIGFQTADDGVTHQSMYRDIMNKTLVNYSVSTEGHIYGAAPEDFASAYTVGPTTTDSLENLSAAGFRDFFPVVMVSEGQIYQERLSKHLEQLPNPAARLNASLATITFARLNYDDRWLSFVDTSDGAQGLEEAANDVVKIANQRTLPIMTYERRLQLLTDMERVIVRTRDQLR